MTRRLWILSLIALLACDHFTRIVPLTDADCPEGARVVGAAPPEGFQQRCERPGSIRHGKSRAWYHNGRLRAETEWWEGKRHATFTLWYENGQKRATGQDRRGIPSGKWTYWDENGNVLQERVFGGTEAPVYRSGAASGAAVIVPQARTR